MSRLFYFFVLLLGLIPYWISRCIPSDRVLWLFGAWQGTKYGDSSKYLFEYINKNHPEIKAVWITRNKKTLNLIKDKGFKAFYLYSLKGFWYTSRAYVNIYNVSSYDISTFMPAKVLVNLWHGIPLKKIGYDNKVSLVLNYNKFNYLKKLVPYLRAEEKASITISSSYAEREILSSAFNLPIEKIEVTGLPRNDVFKRNDNGSLKKIIYMPTWRVEGSGEIGKLLMNNITLINSKLIDNNIVLHIKLHPNDEKDVYFSNYSNVQLIIEDEIEQDIYSVVNGYDLLITDYSSIYFDFLLTEKPIIFFQFDFETYTTSDREFYFDVNAVTPGPKCKSWEEVLHWINEFSLSQEQYKSERKLIKNQFHLHQDSQSSARVTNAINDFIFNK